MKHIEDRVIRGHEVVIHKSNDGKYLVDIRADNSEGEFMVGYAGIENIEMARLVARSFISGYYYQSDEEGLVSDR